MISGVYAPDELERSLSLREHVGPTQDVLYVLAVDRPAEVLADLSQQRALVHDDLFVPEQLQQRISLHAGVFNQGPRQVRGVPQHVVGDGCLQGLAPFLQQRLTSRACFGQRMRKSARKIFAHQGIAGISNQQYLAAGVEQTPGGDVCIDVLAPNAVVVTADRGPLAVKRIGREIVSRMGAQARAAPIRIKSGALRHALPVRDLLVSPDQSILFDGVLVQAAALINGSTIVRETQVLPGFVYCRLELPAPALIKAEGVLAETGGGGLAAELPYPRAASVRQLPAWIARKLARRAQALAILPT